MSPMSPRLLRPRQTGFDPRNVSGLMAWWDFSDASTLGPTSSGTGTVSNNGPVKYVGDKSGNGRNLTQSGADSVAPTYLTSALNGLSALGFDGGDWLTCTLGSAITFTAETIFVVFRRGSSAGAYGRLFTQSAGALEDYAVTGHYIPILIPNAVAALASFAGNGHGRAQVSVTTGTWGIFSSQHTGAQIQNRLNNGTAGTYSHTLNVAFDTFRVGQSINVAAPNNSGDFWHDRIAEVIVYTKSLTDTERNATASYLGKKWNITVS